MEKLMRPATEMTMSTLLSVSSSVTGMSDWRAKEEKSGSGRKIGQTKH